MILLTADAATSSITIPLLIWLLSIIIIVFNMLYQSIKNAKRIGEE